LWADSLIVGESAEFIRNLDLNRLISRVQSDINLLFDNVDVGLIEPLVLAEDFSHFLLNHLLMLLNH
jgi:hypothetical protein